MTTKVRTRNSVYEIDHKNKRYRRLSSTHKPTPRQNEDGEWKEYDNLGVSKTGAGIDMTIVDDPTELRQGESAVFHYGDGKTTVTSPLQDITRQDKNNRKETK